MTGSIQRAVLPRWWDPARAFVALYESSPYAFWLDAGEGAETGVSYLAEAAPGSRFVTASVPDGTVTVTVVGAPDPSVEPAPAITSPETIFEFLREDLARRAALDDTTEQGFRLGWVGWLGYELGAQTVGTPVHVSRYPDAALLEVNRALVFDHAARTVTALIHVPSWSAEKGTVDGTGSAEDWARAVSATLRASPEPVPADAARPVPVDAARPVAHWRHDAERYAELILRCQASIREGDAYQLCLTNEIRIDARPDPVVAYLALRAGSPSHHGGLLRFGATALLSASPEQFLAVTRDGLVTTKPIKGTSPRGGTAALDDELRAGLESSEKERAENLMIVDLMRNDLGRIAELGSVTVSSLLAVESYAHVHQLVSTVEARLAPGLSSVDAVAACFPAGSMTGAPKISAMTILDDLEDGPRGIYAGAFGYVGLDGAVDLAMVIRSIVLDGDGASIGTGGGITALSVPASEIEETRIKAAALLDALGAGTAPTRRRHPGSE
ncbi:anthranilate synthase component 1/para-aminobenzoate synthetase [Cryobacterium psychrotolerans]|uniref:Anthranilate synthase component 1/para-aminobenzoate synthetase n=1 Tax=Cryobacterium psychrotolerans TaxID=386301 RepID=A0A1G9G3K9_9MICO|nr:MULTISPECIES: anthranilate synthase component I family protein [Cryobacterium]TFD44194.1 anthranilate synthase component I family protein [Cryobacterium sp. TMT1-2-1]TFD89359.1 anthranilate synthase component I family protein [Cryobacterium psychrotolerans]SDK95229.1 anthranilate synthase component 1/para-aminobenzoate synthetase [Cryobacterium psychrotolerans]